MRYAENRIPRGERRLKGEIERLNRNSIMIVIRIYRQIERQL